MSVSATYMVGNPLILHIVATNNQFYLNILFIWLMTSPLLRCRNCNRPLHLRRCCWQFGSEGDESRDLLCSEASGGRGGLIANAELNVPDNHWVPFRPEVVCWGRSGRIPQRLKPSAPWIILHSPHYIPPLPQIWFYPEGKKKKNCAMCTYF